MPQMNVTAAVGPAFDHMTKVMFRPFVFRKWLALGFIAMFLGGTSSPNFFQQWGSHTNQTGAHLGTWFAHYWPVLVVGAFALLILGFVFAWVSAVFRFVYLDDVVRNSGAIKEPFARLKGLGTSLFLWQLAFGLIVLMAVGVFVLPIVFAFALAHHAHPVLRVLAVLWAVMVGFGVLMLAAVIEGLVQAFVTTAMYARGIGILEAWRLVLPILRANVWQVVLYFFLAFAFGIGIGAAGFLVALLVLMILAVPFGGLMVVAILIGAAMHLTWTIPAMVAVGVYAFLVMLLYAYVMNCFMQPGFVFMRAFQLIVLGQAEPSLATIPVGPGPAAQP